MAGTQPVQNRGLLDSAEDWIGQRVADAGSLGDQLAMAGRQAWERATQPDPPDNGVFARRAGNVAGVARGALHMGEGVVQDISHSVSLAGRLINPLDRVLSPPGQSATDQMIRAAQGPADYIAHGLLDPASFGHDVIDKIHQFHVDVDPKASPPDPDPAREQARNFKIGENQGELALEGAALLFGGAASKVLGRLGPISEAAGAAKFKGLGFSDAQAARLARPYNGVGHHFIPQRTKVPASVAGVPLPSTVAGQPLPAFIIDSPFNILKPTNISQGDFYGLHSQVDPYFHGTRIGVKDGGGSWSMKKAQLEKHGLLGNLWYGSPAPLNAAAGGLGIAGLSNFDDSEDDSEGD